MDVLKPELVWIEGRCYRVNKTVDLENVTEIASSNRYIEEDLYADEDDEDNYNIKQIDKNRFITAFHVAQPFFSIIIGAKGATKRRIEGETRTQIKIPRPGVVGDIEITGSTRQNVSSARRRIELIVLSSRSKQQRTHFTCVPVVQSTIKENYLRFKNEILNGPSIFGLDESLFQDPHKLHITFFTMVLLDNTDRTLAGQLLQDCQESIIQPILKDCGPINLSMCGVECMNDDPAEVNILYGRITSEPLQKIADDITNYFIDRGLIQREYDKVKLHMTLINTRFRKSDEDEGTKKPQTHKSFDARDILKKYANYNFGNQIIKEIHLSQRFTTAGNKFYEASAILKIA